MLEKTTTEPGTAKDGKIRAGKAIGTSPMSTRTAARKSVATRSRQDSVQERIRRRAYELWESEGRPEGRAHAHWYQAEMEITRAHSQRADASR
jgi:hypothetical protein